MATYLKRTSKLFDLSVTRASAEVNLRDLICPVCRGILIEPVTLPCTHNLCLRCLKGTFEHNSLSCPLCRVRVGSWLRTATKSETLVNNALWELIRTRFPKEVEGKHNGDEGDIELDSGFTSKKVILSAAGEIRREYEVQLKIAEDEMRRQRETERLANEALIRKIQAEEQQQLAQLEQDQLLARSLAKKQLLSKEKTTMKYYNECKNADGALTASNDKSKTDNRFPTVDNINPTQAQVSSLQVEKTDFSSVKDAPEGRKLNIATISKIRGDKHGAGKTSFSNDCKGSGSDNKTSSQKLLPIHNVVTRTLKQQAVVKYSNPSSSNFAAEPGCSGTQIYGTQSKEELHVPKDVLSNTKKSLGVEVCMTTGEDDERIGSAESAGSHDSINQEIHHFKPIKPMARTALKMSHDGRPIDPKLIRVLPILKRVTNAVPKPPSPTHIKRILGCSWSAFRGKARQNLELRQTSSVKSESETDATSGSTLLLQSHQTLGKLIKSHVSDTVRRLDMAPHPSAWDMSWDRNKNYAKSINRLLNGTKVSKKLILGETEEAAKVNKPSKLQSTKNGAIAKSKRQRNHWSENAKKSHGNSEDPESTSCSPQNLDQQISQPQNCEDAGCTIENIAERIKRRKVNRENATLVESENEPVLSQRSTRRCLQTTKAEIENTEDAKPAKENPAPIRSKRKRNVARAAPRSKRQRVSSVGQTDEGSSSEKVDSSMDSNNETTVESRRKRGNGTPRRNGTKSTRRGKVSKIVAEKNSRKTNKSDESSADDLDEEEEESLPAMKKNDSNDVVLESEQDDMDKQIIEEQQRMERLILQEKEDFALAVRLQSQFNDMERIAGRTRGSRRAMENRNFQLNPGGQTKPGGLSSATKTSKDQNTPSSKNRRRPQKQATK